MKKMLITVVSAVALTWTMASSCKKEDTTPTNCSTSVSFAKDVQPIINNSCAISGCHNGATKPNLTSYASIKAEVDDVKEQVVSGSMPKGRTLSAADKDALLCWIANGAANN